MSSIRRSFPGCRCALRAIPAATAVLAAFTAAPAAATPVTLTFDDASRGSSGAAAWSEGSYKLAFDGTYAMVDGGAASCAPQCAEDAGRYLLSRGGSLSLTPTRSRAFSLTSFDAGLPWSAGTDGDAAQYIDVIGTKGDGRTVTQRFALDFLLDGDGGTAGFQTFTPGADFRELRSVSLRNGGAGHQYSLDNIRLGDPSAGAAAAAVVPEPGTLALVAAALLAAVAGSRRAPPRRRAG